MAYAHQPAAPFQEPELAFDAQERSILTIKIRWALIGMLILYGDLTILFYQSEGFFHIVEENFLFAGVMFFLMIIYNGWCHYTHCKFKPARKTNQMQIMLDMVFITTIIYYSGGVYSWVWTMYPLLIMESAILLERKIDIWLTNAFCIIFYGAVLGAEYYNIVPAVKIHLLNLRSSNTIQLGLISWSWLAILNAFFACVAIYLIGIIRNRENRLKKSREKYQQLVENASDSIFVHDLEGHFLEVNRSACQRLGYTREELLNKKVADIDPLVSENVFAQNILKLKQKGAFTIESAHRRKDGSLMSVEISCRYLRLQGEEIIQSFVRDITERKTLEEEIKLERDKLKSILTYMADGVCIISEKHKIEFMNKVLIDDLGNNIGKKCYQVFHHRTKPCTDCHLKEVLAGKTVKRETYSPTGNKSYDLICTPVKNTDGRISKLRIIRDITDRKKQAKLAQENILLKQTLQKKYNFSNIVGVSPQIYQVFEAIERVSKSKATVLITGESGTGKELVAKAIHYNSPRASNPFIALNCGAIPENLLESELFGHMKGSFTGAVSDKKGLFEEAHGGSLFLDEIGELSFNLQSKLLRVLQESKLKPVGSAQERAVDVRIIAATNKKLEAAVKQGLFRKDLFYRLAVVPIHLPALRERKEDIPLLVKHFIDKIAKQNNRKIEGISTEALETLMNYPWEGNVRELENVLEYAIIFSDSPGVLQLEDLPLRFKADGDLLTSALYNRLSIEEYTKAFIQRHESQYTETSIADMLGITPKSLWEKRKKWGMPRKKGPAGNRSRLNTTDVTN